jgi:hypothetical protein
VLTSALLLTVLGATPHASAAILLVHNEGTAAPEGAREALRAQLQARGVTVLDDATARDRLRAARSDEAVTLQGVESRLAAAEEAFAELETERSLELLEAVIRDLAHAPVFSEDKRLALERARVLAASRLLTVAGPEEDGGATTEAGSRAKEHLVEAVRVGPDLHLSEQEHPPKMHRLLAAARATLGERPRGGLGVSTSEPGATVFLEGRPIGTTPLDLVDAGTVGRYRLWVARGEQRSAPRWVELGSKKARVAIDLAFESALWPEGPGLRRDAGDLEAELVRKAAPLLGVDAIYLVAAARAAQGDGELLLGARVAAAPGEPVARVVTRADDVEAIAAGLEAAGASELDVPAWWLPAAVAEARPASAGDDGLLLWGGIGAAAVVTAVAVAGGATAAALLMQPAPRTFSLQVTP